MDVSSKTESEVRLVYRGFILAWFCFPFMVYKTNLPFRDVSAAAFVALCVLAPSTIVLGFMMRRRFFKLTAEARLRNQGDSTRISRFANSRSMPTAIRLSQTAMFLALEQRPQPPGV
jgi:hypothetical protein